MNLRPGTLSALLLALAWLAGNPPAPAHAASQTDTGAERIAAAERLQAQGKRLEALRALEQSMKEAADAGDPERLALTAGALGQAYLLAAMPAEARRHLELLLAYAREHALPAHESAAWNDLGLLAALEGKNQQAEEAFAEALRTARQGGNGLMASRAALNLARHQLRAGKPAAAAAMLAASREQLSAVADSEDKAYQLIAVARMLAHLEGQAKETETVYRVLAEAMRIARLLGIPRAESFALGELGDLYAGLGRADEALGLARRALFLAQHARADDALYRWHWLVARIHARAGRDDEAMAAYQRALTTLQGVRQDLMAELRVSLESYRQTIGPLFQEYVDLLLRRALAARAEEKKRLLLAARDTFEQLKTVELEDYFQDACVASLQTQKTALDDAVAGTAILYPVLLKDRVELLVSLPGEIRQVQVDVDVQRLIGETERFRLMLEKRTTREFLPHARQLYQWLLAPIRDELERLKIDTLVFVPDGPLRGIPLAALNDGRQYVIERYAVAVAPGLSLVEEAATGKGARKSLLGGITESVQNFPALPYVEPEVQSIQSVYAGKALKDAQFVIPAFESEMRNPDYSIIHIASHGQIESDPRKSFLLAYDGKITMDDLESYMKYSRMREEGIDLLTLSACRTAAGDDRAALGLAGVAVKAGARSALATLWYVSDQASSMLVTQFYRSLSSGGISKARALQEAQRSVLADPRYRHPGYWSPFLLIGNWR